MSSSATIVYDWNGTLLDDAAVSHECFLLLLKSIGRSAVSFEQFQEYFDYPLDRLYINAGFARDEIEKNMEAFQRLFHNNYEPIADGLPLRQSALEILRLAKDNGVRQVILSNHITEAITRQTARLGIGDLFDQTLAHGGIEDQVQRATKEGKLVGYIESHKLNPAETIIVGDLTEEVGIAKKLGLVSVAITGGCASEARLRAVGPDYLIHSLKELEPILRERGFVR